MIQSLITSLVILGTILVGLLAIVPSVLELSSSSRPRSRSLPRS